MRRGERLAFVLVGHLLSGRRQAAAVCQCPLRAVASAAPRAVLEGRAAAAVAVACPKNTSCLPDTTKGLLELRGAMSAATPCYTARLCAANRSRT